MGDKINEINAKINYNLKIAVVRVIAIAISVYILYNPPGSREVVEGVEFLSNDPRFFGIGSICIYIIFEQTIKLIEDIIYIEDYHKKWFYEI